jgi:hypothetical protein
MALILAYSDLPILSNIITIHHIITKLSRICVHLVVLSTVDVMHVTDYDFELGFYLQIV